MSKASDYAALPKPTVPEVHLGDVTAFVTDHGDFMIRREDLRILLTAEKALLLRNWLTDTFDTIVGN